MPQAGKKDGSATSQRAQEKESKRARGALSCAECRRLKLKCDKTVPCSSCKRRGCSAICPNGSLITGQGTRFVLADTEKLHTKIATMSDRIRHLEDALAILQSTVTHESHPLLERELLKIKSSIELHAAVDGEGSEGGAGAFGGFGQRDSVQRDTNGGGGDSGNEEPEEYIDAFGTLAIREDGAATFYGRSAGSESLLMGESPSASPSPILSHTSPQSNGSRAGTLSPAMPRRHDSGGFHQGGSPFHQGNNGAAFHDGGAWSGAHDSTRAWTQDGGGTGVWTPGSSAYHGNHDSTTLDAYTAGFPFAGGASDAPRLTLPQLAARLPSYADARALCELYLAQAPWFFGAVTRGQLEGEVLAMWFPEESGAGAPHATTPRDASPPPAGSAHDLALLFVILCFGALGDTRVPFPGAAAPRPGESSSIDVDGSPKTSSASSNHASPHTTSSSNHTSPSLNHTTTSNGNTPAPLPRPPAHWYRLTKAALILSPVLEGPPSVATVQTLALMAIYEGLCAGENSIESTWAIFGLATKLAQSIGLHRDCARWGLKPGEVQKRRALFWELFITDCWQALATGRLPTFSLPFVDCELPQDVDQTFAEDGAPQSSFPYWKARFGAECVSAVVQGTLTSRAPRYSIILELDRKVRDMEFPQYALGAPPEGKGMSQTMSHFMPINYRHLTLLYIHRCFFAHAISNHPHDPIKSPYAPSFLAGYRSACDLLASLRLQFNAFPAQIARFWVLWTHAFSSAIMLSSVVTHATRSKVAPAALLELGKACELFEEAAVYGGRATKFIPILQRLSKKAVQVFEEARHGAPPTIPNNIFEPSRPDAQNDELSIFSGKTHTLTTKSKRPSQQQQQSQSQHPSPPSARSSTASDSPGQTFTDNPSFAGVHPSLVKELNVFDGHIESQIQHGYFPNGVFAQPMIVQAQLQQHQRERFRIQGQPQYQQQFLEHEEYRRRQQQQAQQEEELRRQQQQVQQHQQNGYAYQAATPPQGYDAYAHPHGGVAAPTPLHSGGEAAHTLVHSRSHRSMRQGYQQHAHSSSSSHTNLHHAPEQPRILTHSQSHRSLRQAYDAQQQQQHPDAAHHEQQQQLYGGAPPAYKRPGSQLQSPITDSNSSPGHSHVPSPDAMYSDESPVHSPYQTMNPQYWPPPAGFAPPPPPLHAEPMQYEMQHHEQAVQRHQMQLEQHQQQLRQINLQLGQPGAEHYTPDRALRGFAAEDPRLQEHWQTYMSKVGSPRMIHDA